MSKIGRLISRAVCLNLILTASVFAGPPFLTDDPEPVDLRHWEAYQFTSGMTAGGGGYSIAGPALELNSGAFPDTTLHLILPLTYVDGGGRSAASGLEDIGVGIQ